MKTKKMKTTTNLIAFDIATALAHPERVRTRDQQKISALFYEKNNPDIRSRVWVRFADSAYLLAYEETGSFLSGTPHPFDLLLIPLPPTFRPWTVDDIPVAGPGERLRFRQRSDAEGLSYYPTAECETSIQIAGCWRPWASLASDWKYTLDGKTWRICQAEVTE